MRQDRITWNRNNYIIPTLIRLSAQLAVLQAQAVSGNASGPGDEDGKLQQLNAVLTRVNISLWVVLFLVLLVKYYYYLEALLFSS